MTLQITSLLIVCAIGNIAQQFPINTMDITSINGLSQVSSSPASIDPKIRKALFNVLSRLEGKIDNNNNSNIAEDEDNNTYVRGYEYRPTVATNLDDRENVTLPESIESIASDGDGKFVYTSTKSPEREDDDQITWEYITNNGTIQKFNVGEVINRNNNNNNNRNYISNNNRNNVSIIDISPDDNDNRQNQSGIDDELKDAVVNSNEQQTLFNQLKQQLLERLKQNRPTVNNNQSREIKGLDVSQQSLFNKEESLKSEESAGMYAAGASGGGSLLNFVKFMMVQNGHDKNASNESDKQQQQRQSNEELTSKEKSVEIHKAPLVAAFTLEQDQYGLPKRVVPLDDFSKTYLEAMTRRLNQEIGKSSTISNDNDIRQPDLSLLLENEKKETRMDIEEKLKEIFKKKQELETEKRKYLSELEKRKQYKHKEQSLQHQQQYHQRHQQQFIPTSASFVTPQFTSSAAGAPPIILNNSPVKEQPIEFDKSVEFQSHDEMMFPPGASDKTNFVEFSPSVSNYLEYPPVASTFSEFPPSRLRSKPNLPQFTFNSLPQSSVYRANRNEPPKFVGNFEYPLVKPETYEFDSHPSAAAGNFVWHKPEIVDRQLQSLIYQSGIPKIGKFEDVNIVSKVLALDHKGHGMGTTSVGNDAVGHRIKYRDSLFAESSPPHFYPQLYPPSYKVALPSSFAPFKRGR